MNFDSSSEHNLVRGSFSLFIGESFEEEFCCLPDIDQSLFDG